MVLEPVPEILTSWADLHEIGGAPRAAQGDGRLLVEQQLDVERVVRLARPALLLLLDEPDDRRIAFGKLAFVREVGRSGGRRDEREARRRAAGAEASHQRTIEGSRGRAAS